MSSPKPRPDRPEVGKLLFGDPSLAELISRESTRGLPKRVSADPEATERGLAGLVLAIIDLVRQLLERQAVRRGAPPACILLGGPGATRRPRGRGEGRRLW